MYCFQVMVLCKRRKTCFVGAFQNQPIPEENEITSNYNSRRDSVESGTSSGSEGKSWVRCAVGPDSVEGEYTLISNKNYDKYLAALGAGPLSSNMVLRAKTNLCIKQVKTQLYCCG